jgi:polygalacturonase
MKRFLIIFIFFILNILSPANYVSVGYDNSLFPLKTGESIQSAINYLDQFGGGTIELSEGEFILHSTIYPKSNISIFGQGSSTILKKAEVYAFSTLKNEALIDETVIYVTDPTNFYIGQGVNIGAENVKYNITTLTKIKNIEKNKITLEDPILFSCTKNPYIANNFPCIFVNFAENVKIENLIVDGSRDLTPFISSWQIGGIKTWEALNFIAKNIEIKFISGDGISFGQSDHVFLDNLYIHDTDQIAIHLANGSKYATVSNCFLQNAGRNDQFNGAGIFLCWNIENALILNNICSNNLGGGISLGHNDNYNLFMNNTVTFNFAGGIRFRSDGQNLCKENIFISNNVHSNSAFDLVVEGFPTNVYIDKKYYSNAQINLIPISPSIKMYFSNLTNLIEMYSSFYQHYPLMIKNIVMTPNFKQ